MPTFESWSERFVFGYRRSILCTLTVLTIFFVYQIYDLEVDSNMRKMVPVEHPYIQNFLKNRGDLRLGNDIRIVVENTQGDIFDPEFLEVVRQISDSVFYLPTIDRSRLKSLWTPNTRWSEVDIEGIRGGQIIPPEFDGSPEAIHQVRQNLYKSDLIGNIVADDFRSTMIHAHLIDVDEQDAHGVAKINYRLLAEQIETGIRQRYEAENITIHIIGFSKKIGELIDAAKGVVLFFIAMVLITFHMLVVDSHCTRSASVIVVGALMAVAWQLGLVTLLRKGMHLVRDTPFWQSLIEQHPSLEPMQFGVDPYSMLIPFLVFAIAVSHGVQFTHEMTVRTEQGESAFNASKNTFRILFVPGLLALISDSIGFITLWFVDIGVIRELAITASIGVAVIILTKLIFLPVILSYIGVGSRKVRFKKERKPNRIWRWVALLTYRKQAIVTLSVALLIAISAFVIRQDLKIGDLDAGAPELRPDSRYNLDNAYITGHYSVSADVLVVMAESPPNTCSTYNVLSRLDRFMSYMDSIEGVESSASLVTAAKHIITGFNEGSLKWASLPRVPASLNGAMIYLPSGFNNAECSLVPIYVFLKDHKADTLERAVQAVHNYPNAEEDSEAVTYVLASGSAGVEAATNQTIKEAQPRLLLMVYAVVSLLVWMAFRSFSAVLCIVIPLMLTSILCEALMTLLGIGVKVATLPVIALGVGIGVDYGIYIYAKMRRGLVRGLNLHDAYFEALKITGRSVVFTGVTLVISVSFWIQSAIKFQSDMGILLSFMFLWNMIGAICLIPVLAHFLVPRNQLAGQHA